MFQQELYMYIQAEAEKINRVMRDDLAAIEDTSLAEIVDYALFNGGKRLRPILCILAARLCGARDNKAARLAIAFEYLHAATLLHDDVIDRADTRRGRRAANLVWGRTPAILAGDYLHARSMYLVGQLGRGDALDIICRTTAAMVEGEFKQLHNARNFNQSEADYLAVVEGKTALLIAAVCEIGARFAEGTEQQVAALKSYGAALGTAFQITDDLLDYLGDPEKTGKGVGNDFCEGKMTLPLIHALDNAANPERQAIMNLLAGEPEQRRQAIARIIPFIEQHNGFQYARQRAKELTDRAIRELEPFKAEELTTYKNILIGLACFVLNREK